VRGRPAMVKPRIHGSGMSPTASLSPPVCVCVYVYVRDVPVL
jgi:hypothetical protein